MSNLQILIADRKSIPSLQEIAKLSIQERHQLLSPFIEEMAEDFINNPELTEFSVLDGENWEEHEHQSSKR